ncbi:MAG TPA: transporter substrate-binding domain-containing protein [Gaiellaceae bacterium]|nr:transporter substrate-binding domain-containing protein [Gaiellaceae bacterium]
MKSPRFFTLLLALSLALVAAGCGGSDDSGDEASGSDTGATTETAAADPCAKDQLELTTAGKLTIGTDNPSFPPWFIAPDGGPWDPTTEPTKEGYEAAVAYAVADQLGFSDEEVEWQAVPFEQSFKPGPKNFDFDINQVSYTAKKAEAVDFSDSYYDTNQAVVALKSSKIAGAASIADLADAKLGAPIGTTSYDYIVQNVKPSQEPSVYNTLNDAIAGLKAKQVDGIVVDLPTAFFVTTAQVPNSKIVGQFPAVGEQEYFGLVLAKDSPLTDCVNDALGTLRDDGTLDSLLQEWLSDKASAPVLE